MRVVGGLYRQRAGCVLSVVCVGNGRGAYSHPYNQGGAPLRSVPLRSVPFRSVPFRSVPFRSVPITLSGGGRGGWVVYACLVGVACGRGLAGWACFRCRGGRGLAGWSVMALDTPHLDKPRIAPPSMKYITENSMRTNPPKYYDTIVTL